MAAFVLRVVFRGGVGHWYMGPLLPVMAHSSLSTWPTPPCHLILPVWFRNLINLICFIIQIQKMPFIYKRKRENFGQTDQTIMKDAVNDVLGGQTERRTAKKFSVPRSTLQRYVKKAGEEGLEDMRLTPNYANGKVFSAEQENDLVGYLQTSSRMHHGLTTNATRALAYDYALKNSIPVP